MEQRVWLSADSAGREVGVSGTAVRSWCAKNLIEHIVLPSGQYRISRATVARILEPRGAYQRHPAR